MLLGEAWIDGSFTVKARRGRGECFTAKTRGDAKGEREERKGTRAKGEE